MLPPGKKELENYFHVLCYCAFIKPKYLISKHQSTALNICKRRTVALVPMHPHPLSITRLMTWVPNSVQLQTMSSSWHNLITLRLVMHLLSISWRGSSVVGTCSVDKDENEEAMSVDSEEEEPGYDAPPPQKFSGYSNQSKKQPPPRTKVRPCSVVVWYQLPRSNYS